MNTLDQLTKFIENQRKTFKLQVATLSNMISLNDLLEKLKKATPMKHHNFGGDNAWFVFHIGPYEVDVRPKEIHLYGFNHLVKRKFRGELIENLYSNLVDDYTKLKKVSEKF